MSEHPNRAYYILNTIIVRNLFGVDIMPETAEICKLRLFLKLAAQAYAGVARLITRAAIPKLGNEVAVSVLRRIQGKVPLGRRTVGTRDPATVWYHNAPQYWIRATDFLPYFWNERDGQRPSVHIKTLVASCHEQARMLVAALNSSLFYWWFIIMSDCRDLNAREVDAFPAGIDEMSPELTAAVGVVVDRLMADYRKNSRRKRCNYKATGRVEYDEFYPGLSKPILDEIDQLLAKHYGLTDEELDFIINYDIKFRMGRNAGEE